SWPHREWNTDRLPSTVLLDRFCQAQPNSCTGTLARRKPECRAEPKLRLPVQRTGKLLQPPFDALALQIGVRLRQGPHQPSALETERTMRQRTGLRPRDHMGGAERRAEDSRALDHVFADEIDQTLAKFVLHQSLVPIIDGKREESPAAMVDACEIAMGDKIEALHATIFGVRMPADVGEQARRLTQALLLRSFVKPLPAEQGFGPGNQLIGGVDRPRAAPCQIFAANEQHIAALIFFTQERVDQPFTNTES